MDPAGPVCHVLNQTQNEPKINICVKTMTKQLKMKI